MTAVSTANDAALLEKARRDLIRQRDPRTIPNLCRPAVLVAMGDSLTSAHNQTANDLTKCGGTTGDPERGAGNDGNFSYAGRYFVANEQIVEYYNFARTGFSTMNMLVTGEDDRDGCRNLWGRDMYPIDLAKDIIDRAKRLNRDAYFVTTGGINDTNWTEVLEKSLACHALEIARREKPGQDKPDFKWRAHNGGGLESILAHGGHCLITVIWNRGDEKVYSIEIPKFDAPYTAIGARARDIVHRILAAGADRVVWMLYYDLNPGRIQVRHLVEQRIKESPLAKILFNTEKLADGLLPVVHPDWANAARGIQDKLNLEIVKQIPRGLTHEQWAKVRLVTPKLATGDIQQTAKGGSPHPSATGHERMADQLANAVRVPNNAKTFALRAHANGKLAVAEPGATNPVIAAATVQGPWELFYMVPLIRPYWLGTERYVALLSLSGYHYVTAEKVPNAFGTDRPLIANRTRVGAWTASNSPPWEAFQVIENQDGSIVLKAMINNEYVIAEDAGSGPLTARSSAIQPIQDHPWSKYTVVPAPSGVFLRARTNNRYVTAPRRGDDPLIASSTTAGPWETFHLVELGNLGEVGKRYVALVSHANLRYVTARNHGNESLLAAATAIEPWTDHHWEIFELAKHPDGGCTLRAFVNKKYVLAGDGGNAPLIAGRAQEPPEAWEQFDLIPFNTTIRPC